MIRFLFRLLGFLVLAGGFVALVVDGTRAVASGAWDFTKTETSWAAFSPQTLQSARELVGEPGAAAFGWLVAQPTALVLGVLGVLLMLLGRRRRRTVGVVP